jgi:anti-sigma B factor antagonist
VASPPDRPALSVEVVAPSGGGRTTVAAAGELDLATVDELGAVVREQLRGAPVLLDLGGVSFMDSSGIRLLDGLLRDCAREGWDLAIATGLHDAVVQVLELTGMMGALPFARHEEGRPR